MFQVIKNNVNLKHQPLVFQVIQDKVNSHVPAFSVPSDPGENYTWMEYVSVPSDPEEKHLTSLSVPSDPEEK